MYIDCRHYYGPSNHQPYYSQTGNDWWSYLSPTAWMDYFKQKVNETVSYVAYCGLFRTARVLDNQLGTKMFSTFMYNSGKNQGWNLYECPI